MRSNHAGRFFFELLNTGAAIASQNVKELGFMSTINEVRY